VAQESRKKFAAELLQQQRTRREEQEPDAPSMGNLVPIGAQFVGISVRFRGSLYKIADWRQKPAEPLFMRFRE
jgi:hypothetical protein